MSASKTYAELVVELAELDEEIEQARARERVDAIAQVHSLMDTYAIKHRDLVGRNGSRGPYIVKVLPARYRDPASGKEWSGRGNAQLWIRGKDRRQFVIAKLPSTFKKTRAN
ncbi:H-NS histone family protein [Burkholderia sp. AU30198]|uniref:H-NS histone family protein n=1 Tax=Burkholderia sp. AU30198 TaxID=2879627 RepID=UPI001CF2C257|nr:H-NS histone family protein [Burkholderia sp. AU30198]MCA8298979.1 H-NS histone family protein [Burkholderia sp. AU30198]